VIVETGRAAHGTTAWLRLTGHLRTCPAQEKELVSGLRRNDKEKRE